MADKVLCDTGIWLDYFLGNRPLHDAARLLVHVCEREGITLLVSPTTLNDFFYLCQLELCQATRKATGGLTDQQEHAAHEVAWAGLENLSEIATVVLADASDVWLARNHRSVHGDFEDDLIVAAAQRAKVDFLITNDETLLRHAPVAALTAEDAVKVLKSRSASRGEGIA